MEKGIERNFSDCVSLVIVNWNGKKYLKGCLDSIKEQTYQNYEVLLVDNASTDGSVEYIKINFPWVNIICKKENTGSANGHNVGLQRARGNLIAMLDNDVVLDRRWLEELVKTIHISLNVGIVGGNVFSYDPPHTVIFFPNRFIPSLKRPWALLSLPLGKTYDQEVSTDVIQSCAVLLKKEVINKIGFLDEEFFFWGEDEDFCLRARRASFSIFFNPRAVVWHKASGLISRFKKPRRFLHAQFHFMRKNYSLWQMLPATIFMFYSIFVFILLKR